MNSATPDLASTAHVVGFYADDEDLVDRVTEYLIEGFIDGCPALVVTSEVHRRLLRERLGEEIGAGLVHFVDAEATLARVMIGGRPDGQRFASVVGGLIDSVGPGPTRVYGEMVQLLWEDGHVNAAIQLEGLWNDLARHHDFSLYCAYRSETVNTDTGARQTMCRLHSALVGPPPKLPEDAFTADDVRSAEMGPTPDAPCRARRLVLDALQEWEWTGDRGNAALIATELSTNAVLHARSAFRICLTRTGEAIRISVGDLFPGGPVLLGASPDATSGRGLTIVAALADRWGHQIGVDGKEVWAEIHSGRV